MDRQDIDALLISALYGELTPADEARLQAHLEAHPGDRGALDDLKVARQKLHDSRIFEIQLEPPQAVSALLLQEAHRRAPKRVVAAETGEREGWFARFAKSFMSHPAMAAAAMLVLVLGGAGIVYMKKGDQFAAKEMSAPAVSSEQAERNMPTGTVATAAPRGEAAYDNAAAAGSGYNAQLYEGEGGRPEAEKAADSRADQGASLERQRAAVVQAQQELDRRKQAVEMSKRERDLAIEVAPSERAPKDFDQRKVDRKADSASDDEYSSRPGTATGAKAKGASAGPSAAYGDGNANAVSGADIATGSVVGGESPRAAGAGGGGYAQPPPPAPAQVATNKPTTAPTAPPTATAAKSPAPAPKTATVAKKAAPAPSMDEPDAVVAKESKQDSSLLAWAKGEHARAVALAQKGDCSGAAKVALTISNRASSYYSQNMATDRALKQCTQYIAAERERAAKARAAKSQPTATETK